MVKQCVVRCLVMCAIVLCFSSLAAQHKDSLNFSSNHKLKEVVVYGSLVSRVNKSAFNVVAIDVRSLRNTGLSVGNALARVSGLKLRESGGLGSEMSLNINGFSSKHIKFFIDGVPLETFSSSFSLNNIPIAFASQLQVYKGVVPIELGGDALGGAINIVSNHNSNTYLDASYSFGSFNTHKTNVLFGTTTKHNFMFRVNLYQNYSNNNYKVKTQYTNLSTLSFSNEEKWFKRFHDKYHNEAIIISGGLSNRWWADKFIVGFQYSHDNAQIQNANLMKIVFGGKLRKSFGVTPSLLYEKYNVLKGLNFRLSARYNIAQTQNIDTLSRIYSWTGSYISKATQGEGVASLAKFYANTLSVVGNITYSPGTGHLFSFNETYNRYNRHTSNNIATSKLLSEATFMQRVQSKNTVALSYNYNYKQAFNLVSFAKLYTSKVFGPVNISSNSQAHYVEKSLANKALGFGLASTYRLNNGTQFKLSYERALRLPTDREVFGDGDYELGQTTLKPEQSDNINFNVGYSKNINRVHSISLDLAFFYRKVGNYIIRSISEKGTAMSSNHGRVLGQGIDLSFNYSYLNKLYLDLNYSLQNTRNKERYNSIGAMSNTYNNRVPNIPYSFGNANAQYVFSNVLGLNNTLTFSFYTQYIKKFFRSWHGDGAKLYIPNQFSCDASVLYSIAQGKYNIAIEANNITNSLLFDNYSLQKSGRNVSIKFRYVFYKHNNHNKHTKHNKYKTK